MKVTTKNFAIDSAERTVKNYSLEQIKQLSKNCYDEKEYGLAIIYFKEGAVSGDAESQYYYARML